MGRHLLLLGGTGSSEGSWYMMVLGHFRAVLVGTWWYWVSRRRFLGQYKAVRTESIWVSGWKGLKKGSFQVFQHGDKQPNNRLILEQSDLISRKFELYQTSAINEFIDFGSTNILVVNECIQYDESSTCNDLGQDAQIKWKEGPTKVSQFYYLQMTSCSS